METFQSKLHKNYAKPLKMTSIEETIQLARLQQAANASSLYERKHNQKALKVLTVAAYILFVSMAAIILSFYYIFIWDPTTKTMTPRPATNCETARKIIIPENIAIKLANSSEVSAEYFFRDIYRRYQLLQKKERKERFKKRIRVHKVQFPKDIREPKLTESIRPTIPTIESSSSTNKNTIVPMQTTSISNSAFAMQSNDQYVDDEDLESDLEEASGSNRMRNETSIAYHFDDASDNDD